MMQTQTGTVNSEELRVKKRQKRSKRDSRASTVKTDTDKGDTERQLK
jgi:hypothetical protein